MKYIIAVVFSDEGLISLRNFLQRQKNRQLPCHETPINVAVVVGNVTDKKVLCRSNAASHQWCTLDKWTTSCLQLDTENNSDEVNVAEVLHQITDTLPYAGILIDVVCELPNLKDERSDSYLCLFGALRRLKDWHNAQITTAHIGSHLIEDYEDDNRSRNFFGSLIGSKNIGCFEDFDCVSEAHLWRGKISLIDKMVNRGFILSGFALKDRGNSHSKSKENSPVLGRMLEVLDEIDVRTIPAYMFTPNQFILSLYDGRSQSQAFMEMTLGNKQMGLLTRMACYGESVDIPKCGECLLNTSTWKESIIADVTFVQEPEEELLDNNDFVYYLLTVPDPVLDSDCHSNLIATKFHQPKQLNGGFVTRLCEINPCMSKTLHLGGEDMTIDLSGLPCLDKYILHDVDKQLLEIQNDLLSEWLETREQNGEATTVKTQDLKKFLDKTQEIFLENIKHQLQKFAPEKNNIRISVESCISEINTNPSDWAERKLLSYQESQKHSLSRLQSTDSVAMSSPIQISEEAATTLDVKDVLKLFKSDATAVAENFSPVRKRHPSRCKKSIVPTPQDMDTETAPNYLESRCHDNYYNRDKKTEKFESHKIKLQEKYIKEETKSVCSSRVFNLPQKQRKTGSKLDTQRCVKTEGLSKSYYGRKELKSLKSPLKSPRKTAFSSSRVAVRKSPRKQVSGRTEQSLSLRRSPRKSMPSNMEIYPSAFSKQSHLMDVKQRRHSLSSLTQKNTSDQDSTQKRNSTSGAVNDVSRVHGSKRKRESTETGEERRSSLDGTASQQRVSRSERHKRRLEDVVRDVLIKHGVDQESQIYQPCSVKLFKVTKLFIMDLPTSENLKQEMRRIAEGQVQQVVDMETRRRQSTSKSLPK